MNIRNLFIAFSLFMGIISCSSDDDNWNDTGSPKEMSGLYILNEGTMGGNNSTLDLYNFETGEYTSNLFTHVNPSIVNGLGDVGNDLQIYNGKMYAVINGSNYIEVMDAKTGIHSGTINIPNCRYITFHKEYAYVSSFAGPILPNNSQLGKIYKVNTSSLSIEDEITVGYQPEEMAIANNKLYVANSGGYSPESYDNSVSIIDLNTFKEIKKLEVGANLWRVKADKNNFVWVTSRGDYAALAPSVSVIDPGSDAVTTTLDATISDFVFYGDLLYYYGTSWTGGSATNTYGVININSKTQTSDHWVNSSTESEIIAPYGLTVNPANGDLFIADAVNYISPGKLYHLDKNGNVKDIKTTGLLPGHFAFLPK